MNIFGLQFETILIAICIMQFRPKYLLRALNSNAFFVEIV